MRIGIDARFYGPTGKGLGRYTQEIVDNVIKIINATESPDQGSGALFGLEKTDIIVFLGADNFSQFIPSSDNVKKVFLPIRWYSWREQIIMPRIIKKEKLDLIHYPHFNVPIMAPGKFVVTIHDLILTHFPTLRATTLSPILYYFKNIAYRLIIRCAIKKARKVITVSEFTKRDLMKKFSVAANKIVVTYEGVADLSKSRNEIFPDEDGGSDFLKNYNFLQSKFLLYVGNAYPHKNLEFLLTSFKTLLDSCPDLRLVLVGKEDYFYQQLHQIASKLELWRVNDENSPVIFAGYVSDKNLEYLYQKSICYVFPSKYEGFGLPPLEAMSHGCPVVSSDRAALPEILGSAALYFNPDNADDFIAGVKEILNDNDLRMDLIAKGRVQASKYDWQRCARETYDVYQSVINGK